VSVQRADSLDSVAAEWDDLAERVSAPPWVRPGWIAAWVDAFGGGAPLEVFADRRDGRLTGVLPLLRRRGGLASPTNWHTPEFGLLAEDASVEGALAEAVFAGRPRSVRLGWIADEGLAAARSTASGVGYRMLERPLMRSPYLPLDEPEPAAAPRVSTVRRHRRSLEREGELRFAVETGAGHLEDGFRIEGSGWKAERGSAIVSRPETRRFYEAVARWAAARGTLRLFFLRLDGRPIAFVLAVQEAGRLSYVKGGFDVELRRFGPGALVTHELVGYAREQGLRGVDFLGGDDHWKLEWTSYVRERLLFQAFAPSPAGLAEWAVQAYGRPLAKRVLSVRRA
jgi:CelD/BcsL family acetyltransferase involved in cellulose biosynthesis